MVLTDTGEPDGLLRLDELGRIRLLAPEEAPGRSAEAGRALDLWQRGGADRNPGEAVAPLRIGAQRHGTGPVLLPGGRRRELDRDRRIGDWAAVVRVCQGALEHVAGEHAEDEVVGSVADRGPLRTADAGQDGADAVARHVGRQLESPFLVQRMCSPLLRVLQQLLYAVHRAFGTREDLRVRQRLAGRVVDDPTAPPNLLVSSSLRLGVPVFGRREWVWLARFGLSGGREWRGLARGERRGRRRGRPGAAERCVHLGCAPQQQQHSPCGQCDHR